MITTAQRTNNVIFFGFVALLAVTIVSMGIIHPSNTFGIVIVPMGISVLGGVASLIRCLFKK